MRSEEMRLRKDESGQSLILITAAMFAVLAMAAFAIDVATWYQKHHAAQVAADASALAAANYMGNGGSAGSATTMATTYASNNGLAINSSNVTVDTTNDTVTVTVPTTGALTFGGIAVSPPNISARAVASWLMTNCAVSGSSCAFMFAADNVCSGNTGVNSFINNQTTTIPHGVTVAQNGTSGALSGSIISASNITTSVNGGATFPTTLAAYSNGTGCTGPSPSSPSPYEAAFQRSITNSFPIDYRQIYSACGTTSIKFGAVTCDSNGFPNYCTPSTESASSTAVTLTTATSNAIYCAAGTGTKSDPSTWNGTINVNVTTNASATYIAGIVNLNPPTGVSLTPASGNRLLVYGAECNNSSPLPTTCPTTHTVTSAAAISLSANGNGSTTISGDFFAPAGVIDSHISGNPNLTGFLEGWDVVYNANGTVTGDGPSVNSSDQFVGDYLTQ
jgi:hypothetical protein